MPRPDLVHNVSARKSQFRGPMLWLPEHGMGKLLMSAPRPVRRLGRGFLLGLPETYRTAVEEAWTLALPQEVIAGLDADEARLGSLLGADRPLWPPAIP